MTRNSKFIPNEKLKIDPKNASIKVINSNAPLIRIYDRVRAGGAYGPFDYNYVLVKDVPTMRGRFSARIGRGKVGRSERFSYLDGGEKISDERVVLSECIDVHSGRNSSTASFRSAAACSPYSHLSPHRSGDSVFDNSQE